MTAMRRITLAALLAVGGFLASAALAGLAQAHDDPGPGRLALPAPQPGDEARYAGSQERFDQRWSPVPYTIEDTEVGWAGPVQASGADGVARTAMELRIRSHYQWTDPSYESDVHEEVFYDVATRQPIQVVDHENFPESSAGGPLNNHINVGGNEFNLGGSVPTDVWFRSATTREWLGPCGFWAPLHGAEIDLAEDVALGGSCDNDKPTGDVFHYDGRETVAGVSAYRFQNVRDPEVRVWYAPGIAFPVQVRDHFSDLYEPAKTHGWVFVWTLTGLRQGAAVPTTDGLLPWDPLESTCRHASLSIL